MKGDSIKPVFEDLLRREDVPGATGVNYDSSGRIAKSSMVLISNRRDAGLSRRTALT